MHLGFRIVFLPWQLSSSIQAIGTIKKIQALAPIRLVFVSCFKKKSVVLLTGLVLRGKFEFRMLHSADAYIMSARGMMRYEL